MEILIFLLLLLWSNDNRAQPQGLATFNYIPTITARNISQQCINDSQHYAAALYNFTDWALFMQESSGKLPEEIQLLTSTPSGNNRFEYGLFDQCISARSDTGRFTGQYCTVFLELEKVGGVELGEPKSKEIEIPKSIFNHLSTKEGIIGLCLPSSCSALDVRKAVAQRVGQFKFPLSGNGLSVLPSSLIKKQNSGDVIVSVTAISDESYCYTQEKVASQSKLDKKAISMTVVIGILVLCVALGTFLDFWKQTRLSTENQELKPAFIAQLLVSFSVIKNWKKLSKKSSRSNQEIGCLNGIRVLTTFYMVLMHFGETILTRFLYNRNMITEETATVWYVHLIGYASFLVDSFFFLSGTLVSWILLQSLDQTKGRFNALLFYIYRYLRLTPVYVFIFGFVATLWERLGSGPDWAYVQGIAKSCRDRWWAHLLYINNYDAYDQSRTCMIESWYLASDMQMYWFSPLIIYPMWRWKRLGLAWAISNLLAFVGLNIGVHIGWKLPPTIMTTRPTVVVTLFEYFSDYMMRTYFRCSPYLVGILIGYFLYKTKKSKIFMKSWTVVVGWILAISTLLLIIFGMMVVAKEDNIPISPLISVSYGALHRPAWAAAIGWIVFACFHGYGGFVNRLLCWEIFTPLSRLSYVIYLTHYTLIRTVFSFLRKPFYYSFFLSIVLYIGILGINVLISTIICIVVEMPFLNLLNILLSSSKVIRTQGKQNEIELKSTGKDVQDPEEGTPCI